jgi:hypothetical protein
MTPSQAILSAWPVWLEAVGGGANVSIDGRPAIKGVVVEEDENIAFGRTVDAPEEASLRVLASEAGEITGTSRITIDGKVVYPTDAARLDPSKTILSVSYRSTRPAYEVA